MFISPLSPCFVPFQVRFCGFTDFATGLWLGLELDEPEGKNDGSNQLTRWALSLARVVSTQKNRTESGGCATKAREPESNIKTLYEVFGIQVL